MKLGFPDIAIIFYLVISTENILKLLSAHEVWVTTMAIAVIGTCLLSGYVLTARFQEAQRIERILKTELAQSAIALWAVRPGYNQQESEKTIRALCTNLDSEDAQVLLKAIISDYSNLLD